MKYITKEDLFSSLVKNDVISLQGVWLDSATAGRGGATISLALRLLEDDVERRRLWEMAGKEYPETHEDKARRIIREIESRLEQEAADDLFILMTA